jgi:hypothetical protein
MKERNAGSDGLCRGFDHVSRRSLSPRRRKALTRNTGLLKLESLYGLTAGQHALDLGLALQQDRIRSIELTVTASRRCSNPCAIRPDFGVIGALGRPRVVLFVLGHCGGAQFSTVASRQYRHGAHLGWPQLRIPDPRDGDRARTRRRDTYYGNPLLQPEHSNTVSLGIVSARERTGARRCFTPSSRTHRGALVSTRAS